MRRIGLSLLVFLLLLATGACDAREGLSVIVPSGSPALAQVFLQRDRADVVDVVNGVDPLVAAFGSASHDIIFAPTNLGAKLIASGADYVFAGAVVFGNYHLVTTGKETFTIAALEGAAIIAFGQNQTSDIVLRHILAENDVTASVSYVDAVATAAALFAADPTLIVLTAEPSLAALRAVVPDLQTIDLQAEYAALHGDASYPQAGVFVRRGIDPAILEDYLSALASSVSAVIADPAAAAAAAKDLAYGFTETAMALAIPGSHLGFLDAVSVRPLVESYFNVILAMNPALIGGSLPGDEFYLIP